MTLIDAILVLAALLAVTVGVGVYTRWQQNRPRHLDPSEIVDAERLGAEALGDRATLLQFSTELCGKCPAVHRTLSDIASDTRGIGAASACMSRSNTPSASPASSDSDKAFSRGATFCQSSSARCRVGAMPVARIEQNPPWQGPMPARVRRFGTP